MAAPAPSGRRHGRAWCSVPGSSESGDASEPVDAVSMAPISHVRSGARAERLAGRQQRRMDDMPVGSIEYAVIAFPGNHFKGEIIPAIQELVDNGIVRILDLVLVVRDADGDVESIEVSALPPTRRRTSRASTRRPGTAQRGRHPASPRAGARVVGGPPRLGERLVLPLRRGRHERRRRARGQRQGPGRVVKEALEYAESIGAAYAAAETPNTDRR